MIFEQFAMAIVGPRTNNRENMKNFQNDDPTGP